MKDLAFMVVNSGLPHSREDIFELERRVSFPVYQDTPERNIWNSMDAGKDDIYIYDRCGRLAYYIPFPLSIMNAEQTLVVSAILAAYHRSPCGARCNSNSISSLESVLNSNADSEESPDDGFNMTSEYLQTTVLPDESNLTLTNETLLDDRALLMNASETDFTEDYNLTISNYTSEEILNGNETETTETDQEPYSYLRNSLYRFFIHSGSLNSSSNDIDFPEATITETINATVMNSAYENNFENASEVNQTELNSQQKPTLQPSKRKKSRCSELEMLECDHWSKRKLFKAHSCCSETDVAVRSQNQRHLCKNYGRRRCKKLHTIFKCCIKTAWSTVGKKAHIPIMQTKIDNSSQETNSTICCKEATSGFKWRVSEAPTCFEDEVAVESVECCINKSRATTPEITEAPQSYNTQVPAESTSRAVNDTVCCKKGTTPAQCRVSNTSTCFEDETVAEKASKPMDSNSVVKVA